MIPLTTPYLTKQDARAAYETTLSGWVTQGPKVKEFEEQFAHYVGAKYAVATSNCTTALHLALVVANIKPEDEVICPSLSFIATANAIKYVGATPVFADVDPYTYNLTAAEAKKHITPKTKAIIVVHQLGLPADLDRFKAIAKKYKLTLIEDAACAIGSAYKGKKIGSHSDLACFSFHPRKVITTGEGGMITTSSKSHYRRLISLRQHGVSVSDRERFTSKKVLFEDFVEVGYNYRMSDILAAIGREQLKRIDKILKKRRAIAKHYNAAFGTIDSLRIPTEPPGTVSNYQTYMLYLKKNSPISRDALIEKLLQAGIVTRRGLSSIHKTKTYQDKKGWYLPITEDVSDRSISIPLYVQMSSRDINKVIKNIVRLVSSK